MRLKKPYKDINETMRYIKVQIVDSMPYACRTVPQFKNPKDLFYWLKDKVHYKNDYEQGKDVPRELLQSFPTLMNNNVHGISGAGDCDCFTIAAVASMIANQYKDVFIYLVGREKSHPVHIYAGLKWHGKKYIFDLTNPRFDFERKKYRYKQELPVHWEKW